MVRGQPRIGIFTLRTIKAGKEITYNYNLEWGGKRVKYACLRCAAVLPMPVLFHMTLCLPCLQEGSTLTSTVRTMWCLGDCRS